MLESYQWMLKLVGENLMRKLGTYQFSNQLHTNYILTPQGKTRTKQ